MFLSISYSLRIYVNIWNGGRSLCVWERFMCVFVCMSVCACACVVMIGSVCVFCMLRNWLGQDRQPLLREAISDAFHLCMGCSDKRNNLMYDYFIKGEVFLYCESARNWETKAENPSNAGNFLKSSLEIKTWRTCFKYILGFHSNLLRYF